MVAAGLVVVAAVGVGAAAENRSEGPDRESPASKDGSAFSRSTGVTIVFDDGLDGVLAVDLDRGVAARGTIDGQRAGDQQPRLWRERDSLVVGWGEIWAAPLEGGPSQRLGAATTAVPAVEPGRVWLLDYPGGRTGAGAPTVRLVGLDGDATLEAPGPDPTEYFPALGVRDGLALESRSGLGIWDARAGKVSRRLGSGTSWVSDAHGDLVAWCEDACKTTHVTDVDGDDLVLLPPGQAGAFDERRARFSPDGTQLALPVSGARLAIADVATGEVDVLQGVTLPSASSLGWSPDGRHLFFASYSYGEDRTELGWHDTKRDRTEIASLPFGGALSFVVVDRSDATAFFPPTLGTEGDCPAPVEYPSGRTSTCGFNFQAEPPAATAAMRVTFADGREIELRYPRRLALERFELQTSASIAWPVRSGPLRCCGRVVSVDRTTIAAVYGDAEPIATYPGAGGQPVPYYRGSDAGRSARLNYLVFQFGPWLVEVYDVRQPGDFEDPMTDDERATWAASLEYHVNGYGHLVLDAHPPLAVEPHAHATLGEPGAGGPYVLIEEGPCGHQGSDTITPRAVPDPAGTGAAWCDASTGLHLYAAGPADFVDALSTELVIQPTTPGFAAAGQLNLLS